MKYKLILFDADETLFDFKKAEKQALEKTMITLGLDYQENIHLQMYKSVNSAIWKELEDGLIEQKELKIERFRRFSNVLGVKFDVDNFSKEYTKFLGEGSFLLDNAMELIKELYKSYELIIITNGLALVQDNRIRNSELAKYFQEIIVSEEVGISKPNVGIFEYTLANYKDIDKDKILMVGDSLRSDIQGGINFGIDTCWFNPKCNENSESIMPTYEIKSLMELKSIL